MQRREYKILPNNRLIILIAITSLVVSGYLLFFPIAWQWRVCFLLALTLYLIWLVNGLKKWPISTLIYAKDQWLITCHDKEYKAHLLGDSIVTNMISVLRFKRPGSWRSINCILFPSSLPLHDYRRLVVFLRTTTFHDRLNADDDFHQLQQK